MKGFYKSLFNVSVTVLLTCGVVFFLVKHVTDRHAPEKCPEEVERLKKALKRHGNLDRLVVTEYTFVEKQKKDNSEFFKNNIKHLEEVADRLRDVIFRKKNVCEQLTREYALVKEQLLLMKDGIITQPEYLVIRENAEKLSQVITSLSKLMEQEQDAFLMLENTKYARSEQLRIVNEVLVRYLDVKNKKQAEEAEGSSEEQDLDKNENKKVAWKK